MMTTPRWISHRGTTRPTDLPCAAAISLRTGFEKGSFLPSANGPQDSIGDDGSLGAAAAVAVAGPC